jgi:hypothetical protein
MRLHMSMLAGCVAAFLCAPPASAEVVTSCTSPKGYVYFFSGGIVPQDRSGWQADSINDGTVLLSWKDKKFQIQYKDAQKWKDVESEGGKIYLIQNDTRNFYLFLIIYESGVVEHLLFKIDGRGTGELLFGTIRPTDTFIAKNALLRYACRRS